MEFHLFLLIWQLWSSPAKAIPSPLLPSATNFYRMRLSPYSSGQASRNELLDSQLRQEFELSYRGKWDNKKFLLLGSAILRDVQVAKTLVTKRNSTLLAEKKSNSKEILSLPEGVNLTILETDSYWAKAYEPSRKLTGYLPLHHLHAAWSDPGVYVNIVPTLVRKLPKGAGQILTTLPKLTRVEPQEIKGGWMKISYGGLLGYVDMSHFLGRADFALKALVDKVGWVTLRYRTLDEIETDKNIRYSLSEVLGYWSDPNVGVITESQDGANPPLRAHFKIEKLEARLWGVSRLPLHGEVYWIKSDYVEGESKLMGGVLRNEDLLARGVYSIAFEAATTPPNLSKGLSKLQSNATSNPHSNLQETSSAKIKALASCNGIYQTEDGEHWTPIEIFGKHNYPVAIHPDGTWFVGPYKSQDHGKSFEPFIRWDVLTKTIQPSLTRQVRYVRLQKIEPMGPSQIHLYLDLGFDKAIVKTSTMSQQFKVVKVGF